MNTCTCTCIVQLYFGIGILFVYNNHVYIVHEQCYTNLSYKKDNWIKNIT